MRTGTQNSYAESINKAVEFIEHNYHEQIQLTEIAQRACLSPYHFHRIFKSFTGETAKTLLTRVRLEKAASKLKYSQQAVGFIALECGYQNHETFTRAFRQYFGSTPQNYRSASDASIRQKQQHYKSSQTKLSDLNVEGPTLTTIPDLHLAYIRQYGSYDRIGSALKKLVWWAGTHLVLKLKTTTLGIVHDHPDLTKEEHLRFDACILTRKAIKPTGAIGYKKVSGGKFAVFRYQGPFESFYPVYDYIYHVCLFENQFTLGDKPALEWYIKSPLFHSPENYVTDFYLPIK